LIIDPATELILGIGIVGVNAGEMIAEGVLANEMESHASYLNLTIQTHPTLTEKVMYAEEVIYGNKTHILRPKKRQK
jgi:dihydrolipoamide dehydrogenase